VGYGTLGLDGRFALPWGTALIYFQSRSVPVISVCSPNVTSQSILQGDGM
jgi:hypothetical protein